jgi:hypothetical protein
VPVGIEEFLKKATNAGGPLTDCPPIRRLVHPVDWQACVLLTFLVVKFFKRLSSLRTFLCAPFCCRTEVFALLFTVLIAIT